eukprot:s1053_g8.t4
MGPRRAGEQSLPASVTNLLQHVQEQALQTESEKLASRLIRLLHCVSPRITDGDSPKVLEIDLNVVRSLCADGIPDEDRLGMFVEELLSELPADLAQGANEAREEQRSAFNPSEVTQAVTSRDPECIDVVNPKSHYDVLARILLLYAKLNRGVRYADTFFCFSLLMSDMRDAFVKTMDNEEGGMMGRIDKFSALLKEKDEEVWQHLEELNVAPVYYTVPWLTLMLTQDTASQRCIELDMADVLRLWDSLLSDLARPHPLLCYLCVAMVLLAGDFTDCMRMLQHYPPVPVDDLLQSALRLRAADLTGVGFSSNDLKAASGGVQAAAAMSRRDRACKLVALVVQYSAQRVPGFLGGDHDGDTVMVTLDKGLVAFVKATEEADRLPFGEHDRVESYLDYVLRVVKTPNVRGIAKALPDCICQQQSAVGTAGLHVPARDRSGLICQLQIAVGTAGLQPPAPYRSGHWRTSSASSRSQWALPGFSRQQQIALSTARLQPRPSDCSGHCRASFASSRSQWALPGFSRQQQIALGTARLQPRPPDCSGHCRASFASSRLQWALPDFSRQQQIALGTARLQPRPPDRSGHCRTSARVLENTATDEGWNQQRIKTIERPKAANAQANDTTQGDNVPVHDLDDDEPEEPEQPRCWAKARSYLEEHNILPFVEKLLKTLVQERPADPWGAIAALLPEAASLDTLKKGGPLDKVDEEQPEVPERDWNMMPSVGTWYMIPKPVVLPPKAPPTEAELAREAELAKEAEEAKQAELAKKAKQAELEKSVADHIVSGLVTAGMIPRATQSGGTSPMSTHSPGREEVKVKESAEDERMQQAMSPSFSNQQVLAAIAEVSFDDIDLNKDGVITPEEFAAFVAKVRASLGVEAPPQESAPPAPPAPPAEFPLLPSVGTWYMAKPLRPEVQAAIASTFADADANKDGVISKEEFKDFVEKATALQPAEPSKSQWQLLPSVGTWLATNLEADEPKHKEGLTVEEQVHAAIASASFEDLDTNKDGVITREEFHDFVQKATAFAVVEDTITPREQVQHEEVIVGRLVDHFVAANMPRGTLSGGTSPMASAPGTEVGVKQISPRTMYKRRVEWEAKMEQVRLKNWIDTRLIPSLQEAVKEESVATLCESRGSSRSETPKAAEMRLWIQKQLQSNHEAVREGSVAVVSNTDSRSGTPPAKVDAWLKEQLDMLESSLDQAVKEESVATLCSTGSRTDTPDVKIDSWLKSQLETNLESAVREGSVATLDVESVAAVPLVQLPYADFRKKEPAGSAGPVVEGPAIAELDFAFEDMDYDTVISSAETTIGMVEAIRRSLAEQAGIQPDQIRVTLAPGSVKVKISIACGDVGSATVVLQRATQGDGDPLIRRIGEHVAKVPGARQAQKSGGNLVIGNIRIKATSAGAARPTSAKVREEVAMEALKKAFQLPGEEQETEGGFAAMDANKDGVISKAEFATFKKGGKIVFDGNTALLLSKIVEKDVHTPSDCSIGADASNAAIAKTVEDLVASVGAKAKEGVEEEERTPSAHESALEEQQNALAVKDIVQNLSTQVDENVSQVTNTLASEGETKLASAVVVHPEVERPDASMIGTIASERWPVVNHPEEAGSATDAMTAVVESTNLAKESTDTVVRNMQEEERARLEADRKKEEEELRLEEERKKKVEAAVVAASFDQLDTNKDGVITREEFQDFVHKVQNETSGTLVEEEPAPPPADAEASQNSQSLQDEDPETIQERVNEVLEENSRLRSENEALRVELEQLMALTVTPDMTPPQTGNR